MSEYTNVSNGAVENGMSPTKEEFEPDETIDALPELEKKNERVWNKRQARKLIQSKEKPKYRKSADGSVYEQINKSGADNVGKGKAGTWKKVNNHTVLTKKQRSKIKRNKKHQQQG